MSQQPNTIKFKRVGGTGECNIEATMRCNQDQMNAIMDILLRNEHVRRAAIPVAEGEPK